MTSSLRIVVTGLIAQHQNLGGVTWDYLQYSLGFSRLGHDVYYVEDSGEWPYNTSGGPMGDDWLARDCHRNLTYLHSVLSRFELGDRWAYFFPRERKWFGLPDTKRREILNSADLLINVSGTLEYPERYRVGPRLVYIDSDPGFTQVKAVMGDERFRARMDAHDVHFSFGETLPAKVPPTGHRWLPTRQPIVLSEWSPGRPRRNVFTTIMNWTSYKPLSFGGTTYAQKDVEFFRFLDLPARAAPAVLEVALRTMEHVDWSLLDARDPPATFRTGTNAEPLSVREVLRRSGWLIASAAEVGHDIDTYRNYIESSAAEWSVAKSGYVVGESGWFSCRSACYLAAGKPVVVQDTGFGAVIPAGEGVLSFRTLDDAAAAIHEVSERYERHADAARSVAETHFDANRVLTRLLEDATATGRGAHPLAPVPSDGAADPNELD